jgi:uncharacterized membrane protein YidH (DUF202 family)
MVRLPPADVNRHGPPLPGLATERTTLAWSRTALSLVANGGLLLKVAVTESGAAAVAAWVLAFGAMAAGAFAWAFGMRAYRRVREHILAGRPSVRPEALRGLSTVTILLAVAAAVLAVATA